MAGLMLLTALVIGCSGSGDEAALKEATAVAEQASAALTALDWPAYAALVHPDELFNFKASLFPNIERVAAQLNADSITLFDQKIDMEKMRASTPDEFFVSLMTSLFRSSPELRASFGNMINTHIGAVADADTMVHVVVHTGMMVGLRHVDEMNVTSVRRYEDGWRVRLSTKIQGIGLMLQQSLQMQQPPQTNP